MEIKKSEKANLENKKLLFLEIGLIISLLIVYVAFEWTSKETNTSLLEDNTQVLVEEEIISTNMETPPPPPAAPKIPVLSDQIDIVDDEIELEDDMFMNLEDNANLGVEIMANNFLQSYKMYKKFEIKNIISNFTGQNGI